MAYEVGVAVVTSTRTLRTTITNYRSNRGNCCYFRRKISLELQEHLGSRKEIVKALGTSDSSKADALCRGHAVAYDTIFANALHSLKAAEGVRVSLDSAQRGAIVEQRDNWERAQSEHMEEAERLSYQTEEQSSRSMMRHVSRRLCWKNSDSKLEVKHSAVSVGIMRI